jgi:curved DNA-binding protein CbpA
MFRKSIVLLWHSDLYVLRPASQASTTSLKSQLSLCRHHQQRRSHAIISDGRGSHNHGGHRWPEVTSAHAIPTPYQIFGQKKGSPYSKQRFYELVKLYHPDRHDMSSTNGELSYTIKLERYRLIVAANNILSDPVKRGAYDLYGAGWNGMPDVARSSDATSGKGWGHNPSGPSQNATWEDWERWYTRESEGPQEPRFTSNAAFVGLIVIFAAVGGIGQATRVGSFSSSFVEQRDILHDNIAQDLMRRRRETQNAHGSRQERINNFLKQRDPGGQSSIDSSQLQRTV